MESRKPSLDLETELTCSICTELLYQPLTLLDCLHTFCGACLKEWFSFQAVTAEKNPTPPAPGAALFTCPSCRSTVRDTRRNATVVTLLDMFVAAQPAKARSQADKDEMGQKYQPGDQVLPAVNLREPTSEERRAADRDRRLLEGVRAASLREAVAGSPQPPTSPRRARSRPADRSRDRRNRSSDAHSGRRREGSRRHRAERGHRRGSDLAPDDRERQREWGEVWPRQVEHQSSLRSLIGSAHMGERDIEREIEELARQIQEEGLLDGLDLDNIDLSRDDELSRRVTDAYRRRQRERARRRSNNGTSRPADLSAADARRRPPDSSTRAASRPRTASRPTSGNGLPEDRSRPPPANQSSLEVRDAGRRTRRRTASDGRGAGAPLFPGAETRPAARSQTDLVSRGQHSDPTTPPRQSFGERRSSSTPSVPAPSALLLPPSELLPGAGNASFADRAPQWNRSTGEASAGSHGEASATSPGRAHRPTELAVVQSAASSPGGTASASGHGRARWQLYPEPSIACSRCGRAHIEYELHYNCATCAGGQWNICLDCYRAAKGCLFWFGFGYGAWTKWEKAHRQDETLARPHVLTASRYLPPPSTPGGADGRKTLTANDPKTRLETGTFCARCFAWTNSCFWRCDVCNEGDWGYCNACVTQGRSCTHMLLPLSHEPPSPAGRPISGHRRPATASILGGPRASSMGPFKPLVFRTRCEVCQEGIAPLQVRHHCCSCTSALTPDAAPGDYEICMPCYGNLVAQGQISAENGHAGWRRCPGGHRMVMAGFVEGKIGQWRYVERDVVGGRALRCEVLHDTERRGQGGLQMWSWRRGSETCRRLVTTDVAATAPPATPELGAGGGLAHGFPPEGGPGMRAHARWSWYPRAAADDELLFPRGAEVREIEDVNGDWYFGTYMGAKGLFPASYVRLLEQG